ncbi:LysR family transcriptional regulator [Haloglycomyces albus]|uniref:LysR family transcriptional regulator n=1 Tax=Haloglycomyces albus TaxID=526067 RepID=UPI0004A3F49B|nr:LysR family transcriptional regulator [Haloglycomyces albus]
MNLDWDRLRILNVVARTGSVKDAAGALHMTGPAVSQQLRRIEAEAGATIVVPDGRGLRLTTRGRLLADYAHQVADIMQRAENDLHRDETYVDHVRIASVASIIRGLLGDKLTDFLRDYPRVRVTVTDGETSDHLEQLAAGSMDLVLAESWSTVPLSLPAGVVSRNVGRDDLYIALPTDHPWQSKKCLSIRDLAEARWATCAQGSDPHRAIEQIARREGIELDVSFHVADHQTQLSLVRRGLAVACLPQAHDMSSVVYLPLDTEVYRDLLLLSTDEVHTLALQALIDQLAG